MLDGLHSILSLRCPLEIVKRKRKCMHIRLFYINHSQPSLVGTNPVIQSTAVVMPPPPLPPIWQMTGLTLGGKGFFPPVYSPPTEVCISCLI